MKKTQCLLIVLLAISLSCKNKKNSYPNDLIKLSEQQLLERAKHKKLIDLNNVIYRDEKGVFVPNEDAKELLNTGNYTFDRYSNQEGEIVELWLRPITQKDKEFHKKLLAAYTYKPPTEIKDIDCQDKKNILTQVYELDQNGRNNNDEDYQQHDEQNLITVVSLIEKCGMPTLLEVNQKQMDAIWLVFQHSDNTNRKKYFPFLKKAAENGDLKKSQIAKTHDRILFADGEKQVYGTQLIMNNETKKLELYDLIDPENVDKRRLEVGLGPLKDFLSEFDISFEVTQLD